MRFFRLVVGISVIVQGIASKEFIFIFLGFAFSSMALANIGCCSTTGCSVNQRNNQNPKVIR